MWKLKTGVPFSLPFQKVVLTITSFSYIILILNILEKIKFKLRKNWL